MYPTARTVSELTAIWINPISAEAAPAISGYGPIPKAVAGATTNPIPIITTNPGTMTASGVRMSEILHPVIDAARQIIIPPAMT